MKITALGAPRLSFDVEETNTEVIITFPGKKGIELPKKEGKQIVDLLLQNIQNFQNFRRNILSGK